MKHTGKNKDPLLNLTKPFKVAGATTEPSNPKATSASTFGKAQAPKPAVKFTRSKSSKK